MPKRLLGASSWRASILDAELTSNAKFVALVLSMHVAEIGTGEMPTTVAIAEETSLHRQTVAEMLNELDDAGWLRRRVRGDREWVQLSIGRKHVSTESTSSRTEVSSGSTRANSSSKSTSSTSRATSRAVSTGSTSTRSEMSNGSTRPLLEAMLRACSIDPAQVARSRWSTYQRCANELRDLGATPDEIARRAGNAWFKVTPTSLVGRWAELSNGVGPRKRDRAAEIRERGKR